MSDELDAEVPTLESFLREANTKKANMLRERCKAIKLIRDRLARRSLNFVKKEYRGMLCEILDEDLESLERKIADIDGKAFVYPIDAVEYIDLEIKVAVAEVLNIVFASYIKAERKNDGRLLKFVSKVVGMVNFERF